MTEQKPDTTTATRSRRRWLTHLALFLAIIAIVHWWRAEPLASGDAPPLKGDLVGAGRFDLDDLQSQPVLVHFWATWCPMCRLGDDTIDAIAQDFNAVTVAIQSGDSKEITEHLNRESLSFPVITDPLGELATQWGVSGVPASFIVDGSGKIRFATVGYTTGIGLRARLWAAGRVK